MSRAWSVSSMRVLIAWCPDCEHYLDVSEVGETCPALECPRKLIKRRAYICHACENDGAFFGGLRDFRQHLVEHEFTR